MDNIFPQRVTCNTKLIPSFSAAAFPKIAYGEKCFLGWQECGDSGVTVQYTAIYCDSVSKLTNLISGNLPYYKEGAATICIKSE